MNAAISHGDCASARPRTTRFTLSAAARSSSGAIPSAPAMSIAFTSMCAASHGATAAEVGELGCARLDHLGDPIENLAAVVRRHSRPFRQGTACGADGIAYVLARGAGDVLPFRLVRPPGLTARERAADEQLVRLLDREPRHLPAERLAVVELEVRVEPLASAFAAEARF